MSTRTTTLALEVVSSVDDAAADLGKLESAAAGAVSQVDRLSAANDAAGAKLDAVAGATDNLDATAGAATGALGALASGFELVGNDKAAAALQSAALATDFLSGVGQSAALALQAQSAATKVLTGSQRVLNVVMRANPIGLVVTAVLLLIGGLVLAYKKSEAFRDVVQAAGRVGKAAMDTVVAGVQAVVSWVRDRIPGAFAWFKDKAAAVTRPATAALEGVRDGAKAVYDWVTDIPAKFGQLKDKAEEIAAPLLAPFTAVKDALGWIADKLDNIKPPDWLSKIPGVGRAAVPGAMPGVVDPYTAGTYGLRAGTAGPSNVLQVTIQGAVDPYSTAVQVRDLLARYGFLPTTGATT